MRAAARPPALLAFVPAVQSWAPSEGLVECYEPRLVCPVLSSCALRMSSIVFVCPPHTGPLTHPDRVSSMAYVLHQHLLRASPARPASTHPPPGSTPCMCSFGAGAGRCSHPRTHCIRPFGTGAGRCSRPRTPCIVFFGAGAGRCPPPRTPCILSFGAGAGRCSPPHSLHVLLRRWCWQMLALPHSLHSLLRRWYNRAAADAGSARGTGE